MDLLINLLFLGGRFLRLPVKKAALHPLTSAKGFNKFPELERRYTCLYQERCTPKSPYTYTRRVTRTVKSTKHQQVQTEQQEKKKIKDVAINTVSSNIDGIPVLRHIVVDMKQLSGFDAITTQLIQTCKPMKGETFIVPVVLTKRPLLSNPLSGLFRYHKSFVKECVKYTANRRENNFAKAALKALSAMLRTHESTLTSICTSENTCSINFFKRNLISNPLISSDVCQSSLCTKPARTTANICFIRKAHSKSGNNIENLQDIQRAKALMRNPHTFESLETKLTAIQKIFSGRSSPFNEDKGPNVAPEQEQEEKLIELNRIAFEKLENQLKQETSMRNTTVNWKEVKDQSRLLHVNENEFKKTEKEAELFSKAKIVVKKGQKIQADMNRLETSVNCPKLNFLKNRKLHSEKLNFLDYKLEKRGIVLFEKDDSLNFNYINKELLIHEISDRQSNLEAKIRMFHSKDDPKSILNICKDIKKVKQAEKKLKFPDYLTDSLAAEQEAAENEKKEKQSSVIPETSKTPNTQKETMQDIQTPLEKILNVKTGNQSVLQYVSSEDKQCALPETKAILTKVAKLPEKIDEKTSDTQEYILKATKSYTKLDSSAKNTTASKIPKMRLSKMCIRRRKTIKTRKQITSSKIPIRVHRKPVQIKRLGSKGHKENLKLSITNSVKVLFEKSLDKVKTEPKDSKPEQVKVQPKISEPSLPPKNNAIPFTQMQKELQSYITAAIAPPKQTGESLSDESFVKYESPVLSQDTVEKQQREPYHTNVLNYLPSNIKKIDKKPTLPTNTLWNQYPKITVQPKQTKPSTSKDTQAKLYKARPRKYKYKSKEVLLSDGKKISVTYLESEK